MTGRILLFVLAILAIASVELLVVIACHLSKQNRPWLRRVGGALLVIAVLIIIGTFIDFLREIFEWDLTFME